MSHTSPTHIMYGGSITLGYTLIMEMMRHHDHTNLRPLFFDHEIAITTISAIGLGVMNGGSPKNMLAGAIFGAFTVGPVTWWLKMQGNKLG